MMPRGCETARPGIPDYGRICAKWRDFPLGLRASFFEMASLYTPEARKREIFYGHGQGASVSDTAFFRGGEMMAMTEKPPESEQQKTGTGMALAFGTQFAAGMAVFTAAGWWIDRQLGGGQACTLAGIFLGLFYGGYELWKVVRVLQREDSKPKDNGQKK